MERRKLKDLKTLPLTKKPFEYGRHTETGGWEWREQAITVIFKDGSTIDVEPEKDIRYADYTPDVYGEGKSIIEAITDEGKKVEDINYIKIHYVDRHDYYGEYNEYEEIYLPELPSREEILKYLSNLSDEKLLLCYAISREEW